ncbi:MAG TPA: DegT/DnrJ/EryC1/StrS family aminotransferase [Candidatus Binatia bacterium]|jgi:dTDP-4-amino-4,6-dideoxygalactose transaminase
MNDTGYIPLVDLTRQYREHRTELDAALTGVLEAATFINGPDVTAFEAEFATFCQARHCVGVSSGLEALRLILAALSIGQGDEVILPANTFVATALAVSAVGATPVLVDCDPVTANLTAELVAEAITPRTKAIIPVHLYGQPVDLDPLHALARAHGIPLIEDAAQAHGAAYRGRRCGSLGLAAGFSFYPTKNLGAFGDGGAVVTSDDRIADFVRQARDYGQQRKYEHVVKGGNARLDSMQAAILRVKLRHLDGWNAARRRAAAAYEAHLAGLPGVHLPTMRPDVEPVWHLYVIQVKDRDALVSTLHAAGVGAGIHYPVPIHLQPAYADLGHSAGDFPHAEERAKRIASLPLFPEIREDEIERVSAVVRRFVAG